MDRQKILFQLKAMMSNFETYIKDVKIKDKIGYKEVFKEVISLVSLAINNEQKLSDYEFVNIARLCVSAKELRNIQDDRERALSNLEIVKQQIRQEKNLLNELFDIKEETPRPLQRPASSEKSAGTVRLTKEPATPLEPRNTVEQKETPSEPPKSEPVQVEETKPENVPLGTIEQTNPNPPVEVVIEKEASNEMQESPIKIKETSEHVQEESPSKEIKPENDSEDLLSREMEALSNAMDDCSRDYVLNRSRLENMGFTAHDDEIYSLVASWCGKASSFAKNLEHATEPASIEYGIKFLKNAVVLTKLMSLALTSNNATSFRSRLNALENNLVTMDAYYNKNVPKKMA